MALPAVTAVLTLFYLSAIPLHIAVCIRAGASPWLGAGISAFDPRHAVQRAKSHSLRLKKKISLPPQIDRAAFFRALRFSAEHLQIDFAILEGTFGSRDAALTALVCGGARAASTALSCAARRRIHLILTPDFSAEHLHVELEGMIRVRIGYIMLAALRGAFQYAVRRTKHGQASH